MNSESIVAVNNQTPYQVVIVDSDPTITDLMKYNLESEGYLLRIYNNAEEALDADLGTADLIISEVVLGDINGLMFVSMLKSNELTSFIPVIICSNLDSEDDIVKGFDAGADDYILKPFSLREMMARIKSILRRRVRTNPLEVKQTESTALIYRGLKVDASSKSVTIDGYQLSLTRTELLLLHTLISKPGHFYTHGELYSIVWNKEEDTGSRALDVSVSRLRKKLGDYAGNIVSRSGIGYGFIEK